LSLNDLSFRVETDDGPALRDAVAEFLTERGVTVTSVSEARADRTYFVAASIGGRPHQVEVEATSPEEAVEMVDAKGTVVVGVSETPITPP